jgi:hypothetical protein
MEFNQMIKGKWVNNKSDKLVIVFQSAGRIPDEIMDKILLNQISREEVAPYHQKYNWYKVTAYKNVDYLFLEDYFSNSYGWYMVDSGKNIIAELNQGLTQFIEDNNYKVVTTYGSSKGGTGALLYGLLNPKINNVFSLVPQVHSIKYIEKHMKRYKSLFFPTPDPQFEQYLDNIFFEPDLYKSENCYNTTIYLYTGLEDEQFNETVQLSKFLKSKVKGNNMIINTSSKRHTPLVMDNLDFIFNLLNAITMKQKVSEKKLIKLGSGLSLFKDS